MTEIAQIVDLGLPEKLKDRSYRLKFFIAESSAHIAAQLISLRKRRGLNQKEVASLAGTKQPAISRAEQADYQSWSFSKLKSIADALDARIRVSIEPSEDVLKEYEEEKEAKPKIIEVSSIANLLPWLRSQFNSDFCPYWGSLATFPPKHSGSVGTYYWPNALVTRPSVEPSEVQRELDAARAQIISLQNANNLLEQENYKLKMTMLNTSINSDVQGINTVNSFFDGNPLSKIGQLNGATQKGYAV